MAFHDQRNELRRDQRMAAKIQEEIRLERDGTPGQHLAGRRQQQRFGFGLRRFFVIRRDDDLGERHRLQCLAIGLAGNQARQAFNRLKPFGIM